jgi:hypothetical protein
MFLYLFDILKLSLKTKYNFMEEQKIPQNEEKKVCTDKGFCFCRAILAILIIVFVWAWTPAWADIAITVLAALIILGAGECACKKKK